MPSGEGRVVLVHRVDFERLALFTLFLVGDDVPGACEAAYSEVALVVVALDGPAFLRVIVHAQLAIEAPNAEVDRMVVVGAPRYFG